MRLNVCFNEIALFGPFAALIKAVAAMAEMEVNPVKMYLPNVDRFLGYSDHEDSW